MDKQEAILEAVMKDMSRRGEDIHIISTSSDSVVFTYFST